MPEGTDDTRRKELLTPEWGLAELNPETGSFRGMAIGLLRKLLAEGLADPDRHQNLAPTLAEFMALAEHYRGAMTLHGYLDEHRGPTFGGIAVEGVEMIRDDWTAFTSLEDDEDWVAACREFLDFAGGSDEFTITHRRLHCWWD